MTLIQVQVADLTCANFSLLYGRKFWSKLNDWAEILPNMDLQPTQDSTETLKQEPHQPPRRCGTAGDTSLTLPFHEQRQRVSVPEERGLLRRKAVKGKALLQLAVISRHFSTCCLKLLSDSGLQLLCAAGRSWMRMRAYSYRCGKFIETAKSRTPAGTTSSTPSDTEQLLNMNYSVYLYIFIIIMEFKLPDPSQTRQTTTFCVTLIWYQSCSSIHRL